MHVIHAQHRPLVVTGSRTSLFVLRKKRNCQICRASNGGDKEEYDPDNPDPGVGLKAAWYASEQVGNLIGMFSGDKAKEKVSSTSGPMAKSEVIESIRDDYDKDYFVSGKGDMVAYEDDCLFADPFAGFNGVTRFKNNVSNFGPLLKDVKIDIYEFKELENSVETKWQITCIVDLPWKPRIAASGSTVHELSKDTNKVVKHIEKWDVEPGKVVKELLRPASEEPQNDVEAFFMALANGDSKGMWFATSKYAIIGWLPIVLVSLLVKTVTGEGLQGVFLGTVEGFAYLFVLAGIVTEGIKFIQK